MTSSTWGPSAFRARKTGRSRTRRLLHTVGLAALTAGLVLLVTFTSGVQDLDEVMLAIGATVASLATVVAVTSVQSELAFHEAPRLERVLSDQAARRGQPAVPTPLTKITVELELSQTSKRYYRRVLVPRLAAVASGLLNAADRTRILGRVEAIGRPGHKLTDRLPESLTRRGIPLAQLAGVVQELEQADAGGAAPQDDPTLGSVGRGGTLDQ
ncbi:MAG: hypothetical protein OXM01_11745, partial [Gemmatimonadota bacterium]|nr:hypothetical protein [Gemmatimonadota bacterium]